MIESAITQAVFKLVMAIIAIFIARVSLLWLDRAFNVSFKHTLQQASANARMYYFAARFVGVCIIVGLAI